MKSRIILLMISLVGFVFARASVTPGDELGKKEDVVGTVIHTESKKPMKEVSVSVYMSSKKEKVVVTGEDGNFSFDELKPGKYKFVFEKTGFKKVTMEKVITKTDDAYQLNIEMIELTDFDITPSPFHFPDYQ